MNIFDDASLLYTVAKYYYIDDYSQSEIAKILNISRPQISRLLKRARELEIVKIEISMPNNIKDESKAEKIKKYLNLKDVLIVEDSNDNKLLYVKASEYLSALIENSKKIGVGWNETLYNISIELKYNDSDKQKVFYPLIGNLGNNNNPYLQITTIVDRFAEKFNSKAYFNNYPALIEKKSLNNNDLEKLEEFKKFWSDLDVAVIGLSSRRESYQSYISDIPKVDKLNIDEIEGIILGSFFMNNGETFNYPDKYYINSIMLSELKKIKDIVCIVSGVKKIDIIKFAAMKKYFNILITDEATADSIISNFNL